MKRELRDLFYSVVRPKNEYITWKMGLNSKLLLTAPHGGGMKPLSIPKRKYGKTSMDTYTRRLTKNIIDLSVNKPSYVIADIHRSKVDLNRGVSEACQGNEKAAEIYTNFMKTISWHKNFIIKKYGKGLLVDIHSHNNGDYFQLGYNLSADDYLNVLHTYNLSIIPKSTLNSLGKDLREMLFGQGSIAQSLHEQGYQVYIPRKGEEYFNGGFIVEFFSDGGLGGIQIECPVSVLKKDLSGVSNALYKSINTFIETFIN